VCWKECPQITWLAVGSQRNPQGREQVGQKFFKVFYPWLEAGNLRCTFACLGGSGSVTRKGLSRSSGVEIDGGGVMVVLGEGEKIFLFSLRTAFLVSSQSGHRGEGDKKGGVIAVPGGDAGTASLLLIILKEEFFTQGLRVTFIGKKPRGSSTRYRRRSGSGIFSKEIPGLSLSFQVDR